MEMTVEEQMITRLVEPYTEITSKLVRFLWAPFVQVRGSCILYVFHFFCCCFLGASSASLAQGHDRRLWLKEGRIAGSRARHTVDKTVWAIGKKRKSKHRKVVLCGASLIISQPSKFHYPTLLFWRRIWKLKSRGSRLWAIPCLHYWVLVYRNSDYIWGASSEDINPVSLKAEPFPSS